PLSHEQPSAAGLSRPQSRTCLSAGHLSAGGLERRDTVRFAITGGTGFVGRNIARALAGARQEVLLLARGLDGTDSSIRCLPGATFVALVCDDPAGLAQAFAGCEVVVHC